MDTRLLRWSIYYVEKIAKHCGNGFIYFQI